MGQSRAALTAAGQKKHQLAVGFLLPGLEGQQTAAVDDGVRTVTLLGIMYRQLAQRIQGQLSQSGLLSLQPLLEQRGVAYVESG